MVAAWNGWLICSLIDAAMVFNEPTWLEWPEPPESCWRVHWSMPGCAGPPSPARWVGPGHPRGLRGSYPSLRAAGGGDRRADLAGTRPGTLRCDGASQFDDGKGGFFDTAADAERLYARPQDPTDNATPSGLSATVHALRLLSELTGEDAYADRAMRAAATAGQLVVQAPRFAGWLLADAISYTGNRPAGASGDRGTSDDPARAELVQTAYQAAPAGSVILAGEPEEAGFDLLADRPLI